MGKKSNGPVGEQSPEHDKKALSFQDKYFLLQGENQKLRRQISNLCDALRYWRQRALLSKPKGTTPEDEIRLAKVQAQASETCNQCSCSGLCGRGNHAL